MILHWNINESCNKLALLYNFTSVYTKIASFRNEFPATRGNVCIFTSICIVAYR